MRIYKPAGSSKWWVDFGVHGGKRVRQSACTESREEAEAWGRHQLSQLWRQDRLGDKPIYTWDQAVLQWLKEHQHKRSLDTDKLRLRWWTGKLSGKPLHEVTRTVIENTLAMRGREKIVSRRGNVKPVSPSTLNRYLAIMSGVLHCAAEHGMIAAVPTIRLVPETKRRLRWLTQPEATRLLAELPEHIAAMAEFALATGLREANITGLEWSQVDTARGVAWVHADQAKAGKILTVPLNSSALDVLRRQKGRHLTRVFTFEGEPVAKAGTLAFKKALARAEIGNGFRWHDLRHTWASWHVMAGTSLQALMELGGWASMDMVLRYAHLSPDHLAKYAENSVVDKSPAGVVYGTVVLLHKGKTS